MNLNKFSTWKNKTRARSLKVNKLQRTASPDYLVLIAFDGKGWAVLENKPGFYVRVPVTWLPEGTTLGAVLEFVLTPGHKGTTVVSGMSRVGEQV